MNSTPTVVDTVQLQAARTVLSGVVYRLVARTVADTGIRYTPSAHAPGTWDGLRTAYAKAQHTKILPVWNGASRNALYLSASTNWAFRYWHDMGHLQHGLSFTFHDELALQEAHHAELIRHRVGGKDTLAAQLYWADTVGQLRYSHKHGRFPDNQLAFDVAYVENASRALESVF